jgi:glyoxylate/hydroxypyruvate reductase A
VKSGLARRAGIPNLVIGRGAVDQKNKSAKLANPKVLFKGMLPPGWNAIGQSRFASHGFEAVLADRDPYDPEAIHYFSGFRPPPGFMKTLPNLKAIFSLGAGVDGFLRDPDLPRHVPLVRFVDPTLIHEMAQYVVMQVLMIHRGQRFFDAAQHESAWRQRMLLRPSRDTRIGMLGLGDIGGAIAQTLLPFDFQLSGWSRSRKTIPNVKNFAGADELPQFLAQCDYCVCVLPLTDDTRGILNAKFFAQLPQGAWVINVARGGHMNEQDLIAALDSGHLAGAVLDVYQAEPLPSESPIWRHPKITATPHIAALTDTAAALAFIGDCVARCESGRPLDHVVDLARGY